METLKHFPFLLSCIPVLTVPMRNGNYIIHRPSDRYFVFLPYLWGMETENGSSSRNTRRRFLPYLWGMETYRLLSFFLAPYLFLPYLWGMETLYPLFFIYWSDFRSYRTYEEWKHLIRYLAVSYVIVLTVPMRNGNTAPLPKLYRILVVLTVPMRNGNCLP